MLEDLIKNSLGVSITDRASRIDILSKKVKVLKFMDLLKKVEFLCGEFYQDLSSQNLYPQTYKEREALETELLKTIDGLLAEEQDPKRREEYIWAKHMVKYLIDILLLHHLDNKEKNV